MKQVNRGKWMSALCVCVCVCVCVRVCVHVCVYSADNADIYYILYIYKAYNIPLVH